MAKTYQHKKKKNATDEYLDEDIAILKPSSREADPYRETEAVSGEAAIRKINSVTRPAMVRTEIEVASNQVGSDISEDNRSVLSVAHGEN